MPETRAWPDKFGESQTWQIWDCKRLLRSRTRRKTETWQFTNHFGCFPFKYIFLHSDPNFTTTWCWNKSSDPKILLRLFSHGRNMTHCGCPSENSKIHSGLPRLWLFLLIFGVPIFWTAPKNLYEMNKITSNHSRKITSNRRFSGRTHRFPLRPSPGINVNKLAQPSFSYLADLLGHVLKQKKSADVSPCTFNHQRLWDVWWTF